MCQGEAYKLWLSPHSGIVPNAWGNYRAGDSARFWGKTALPTLAMLVVPTALSTLSQSENPGVPMSIIDRAQQTGATAALAQQTKKSLLAAQRAATSVHSPGSL